MTIEHLDISSRDS